MRGLNGKTKQSHLPPKKAPTLSGRGQSETSLGKTGLKAPAQGGKRACAGLSAIQHRTFTLLSKDHPVAMSKSGRRVVAFYALQQTNGKQAIFKSANLKIIRQNYTQKFFIICVHLSAVAIIFTPAINNTSANTF